jgi:hypothetical protein
MHSPQRAHAFVDESERPGRYLMCAVLIGPKHLADVRRTLIGLCLRGQRRLHLVDERDSRRRLILDRVARLPVQAFVYARPGKPTDARATCLRAMTADLVAAGVRRLVIEPVDGFVHRDRGWIIDELREQGRSIELTYEHVEAHLEPNLWAADAIAWAYGAGGDWRRRIDRLLEIRP